MNLGGETRVPLLPTLFTLGNLLCGFIAIAKAIDALQSSTGDGVLDPAFATELTKGCWFVVAAMIFDALDGRIARMTGQQSPFGAMLDSLSDLVTFGVAPAFIAKVGYEHTMDALGQRYRPSVVTGFCALYLICAALRLARFNADSGEDESEHHTFSGLPSPAAAGFVVACCFFIFGGTSEIGLSDAAAASVGAALLRALPYLAAGLGVLMISRVPYVHVFQRYVGLRLRASMMVRLVLIIWVAVQWHEWALFLLISVYVLGGLFLGLRASRAGRSPVEDLPVPPGDGTLPEPRHTPPQGSPPDDSPPHASGPTGGAT